ncbi:MAG TPA: class I SAM-dependent methyltransferase [Polyangiaceae bacterium]|jgi:methyltransferase (TIGR00027 family)|nr:class I SAM-dependent methyltransferase [Polyangiaceae bacterium]
MRAQAASSSIVVTVMRALADGGVTEVRGFSDPTALPMLPPRWRGVTRFLLARLRAHPRMAARMFEASDGKADLIALRTAALDAAWHAAQAEGIRQLVVLGAGLDGRAYRLDDLARATVFEVDHPATQALKRQVAAAMTAKAARHVYVPVDFERDSLERALADAGHRAEETTAWLWEGVTQYLNPDSTQATLDAIGRRSAAGSPVALTYVVPGTPPPPLVLKIAGEPWIGMMGTSAIAERLARAGMQVVEDTGMREWRARYGASPARQGEVGERIVIATK